MKKICLVFLLFVFSLSTITIYAGSKQLGDRCVAKTQCGFKMTCYKGVCIAKKTFSKGNKLKVGKPCRIKADCIGAGTCAKGKRGKKYCTGKL